MYKKIAMCALALCVVSVSDATEYNDTYGEATYTHQDNANTIGLKGSYEFMPNIAAIGSVQYTSVSNVDASSMYVSGGAAYVGDFAEFDMGYTFHAELAVAKVSVERNGYSVSETESGVIVGAEARKQLLPFIEGFADISVATGNELSDSTVSLGARVGEQESLQGVAMVTLGDDNLLTFGIRLPF